MTDWTIRGERSLDRQPFATSRQGPRPRDDRDFVKHNRDVLDKHRIGKAGISGKMFDPTTKALEESFVEAVLGPRGVDVDFFTLEESQLTVSDGRTNASGDRYTHRTHRSGFFLAFTVFGFQSSEPSVRVVARQDERLCPVRPHREHRNSLLDFPGGLASAFFSSRFRIIESVI